MVLFNTTASYNGVSFLISRLSSQRITRTKKQTINSSLVESRVLGQTTLQKRLTITGVLTGLTADTDRATLEASNDGLPHAYVDGHFDDNYYITRGGLTFNDGASTINHHTFTLTLVEE